MLREEGTYSSEESIRIVLKDHVPRLGDLYLAGGPIIGHFRGVRSGHAMNRRLLEALFADRRAWHGSGAAARGAKPSALLPPAK